jgi:hypothetical protein
MLEEQSHTVGCVFALWLRCGIWSGDGSSNGRCHEGEDGKCELHFSYSIGFGVGDES